MKISEHADHTEKLYKLRAEEIHKWIDGYLSREEAQSTALNEIQKLRYGPDHDNYFWITDMQPVMIMHPWRPDLNGQNLSDYTDRKNRSGKKLFVESVQLVHDWGRGYIFMM